MSVIDLSTLISYEKHWSCPNCDYTHVTKTPRPHAVYHPCKGLVGLRAPMVEAGTRAKVVARERDDYVGAEHPQTDGEGRPVMSIVTTRDDGMDCTVLAPVAVVSRDEVREARQ